MISFPGSKPIIRTSLLLLPILFCLDSWSAGPVRAGLAILQYRVVESYPHDVEAFTQGLLYHDGFLYESTGLYGQSSIRKVELQTGRVVKSSRLAPQLFGEGLALQGDHLYQLTYKAGEGKIYRLGDLEEVGRFGYEGRGWGLTSYGRGFLQSDGSDSLLEREAGSFLVQRKIGVTALNEPLAGLNELEYVDGFIYANVHKSDRIARIEPRTGKVVAWLDLADLRQRLSAQSNPGPLNGIAWLPDRKLFAITGKRWPRLFLIELQE